MPAMIRAILTIAFALVLGCGGAEGAPSLCPAGTRVEDGACVADNPVVCGAGTRLEDGECVPDAQVECGLGTRLEGGFCIPDGHGEGRYEVRVSASEVSADGYSKFRAFAIGTLADGSPSTEPVMFGVSRTGAGNFADPIAELTLTGVDNYYTACNTAIFPGCAGPFRVTLALASDPDTVVAVSHEIELVEPDGVGSLAACEGLGNVVFMDGDEGDWVHPWVDTITMADWSASASPDVEPALLQLSLRPDDDAQGSRWSLDFSTRELGTPLKPQVYPEAQRYPFEDEGRPGFNVSGDGRGCNQLCARFQIHEIELDGPTVQRFAATFEQNCECGSSTLRGCVVYEAP